LPAQGGKKTFCAYTPHGFQAKSTMTANINIKRRLKESGKISIITNKKHLNIT
jgi:hypothetical protein